MVLPAAEEVGGLSRGPRMLAPLPLFGLPWGTLVAAAGRKPLARMDCGMGRGICLLCLLGRGP
eukprot:5706988-Pyramimonas_sp.AAC.1